MNRGLLLILGLPSELLPLPESELLSPLEPDFPPLVSERSFPAESEPSEPSDLELTELETDLELTPGTGTKSPQ